MNLNDIFEYFELENTYNNSLLPAFAKGLIEIHRVECLRKNNRISQAIRIQATGNHGIWEAKKIVLIGFEELKPLFAERTAITADQIDKTYDHIISCLGNLPFKGDVRLTESYLHAYNKGDSNDKKVKTVHAPVGSTVIVEPKHKKFVMQFIQHYLSNYELYFLNA